MKTTCSVAGCKGPVYCRQLCKKHYTRLWRYGDALGRPPSRKSGNCIVEDCGRPVHGHGLCNLHLWRQRKKGDPLNSGRRKLTSDDVREIRALYAAGVTQIALGKKFGTTQANVSLICRSNFRQSWVCCKVPTAVGAGSRACKDCPNRRRKASPH